MPSAVVVACTSRLACRVGLTSRDACRRRGVAVHAIAEPPQRVQPESPKGSVSVRVDNDTDAASTVLSLEADSRPGLLTALTGTFKALGLEVVKASVDAQNGRICDTFHVQDAFGAKITPGDAVNVKRSLEVGDLVVDLMAK